MSATKTKGKAPLTGAFLSSNSGFQRLSQAALSRSRFLRLAAGPLLPFVGLRLSAAAAPNLNWRHSSYLLSMSLILQSLFQVGRVVG
jgi:hypothetical protein